MKQKLLIAFTILLAFFSTAIIVRLYHNGTGSDNDPQAANNWKQETCRIAAIGTAGNPTPTKTIIKPEGLDLELVIKDTVPAQMLKPGDEVTVTVWRTQWDDARLKGAAIAAKRIILGLNREVAVREIQKDGIRIAQSSAPASVNAESMSRIAIFSGVLILGLILYIQHDKKRKDIG